MTDVAMAVPSPDDVPVLHLPSAVRHAEFAELYAATFRELSGYCAVLLKDETLALDIAQEAFVRLFSRWRSVANPRGFLFLVATNLIRDEWRRHKGLRKLMSGLEPLVVEVATTRDSAALYDIVGRLPAGLRDVVVLHFIADLPVAEVARVLKLPVGTVKRRLYDARARLRLDWTDPR